MDVKSTFLNSLISKEVFVKQPPGFENENLPHHVFKLSKAFNGLKQAPRAWYERLCSFLPKNGFERGKVDTTLFTLHEKNDLLIVQIYVDDIVFSATNQNLCKNLSELMQGEFEMSMMGELKFFLGLQIKQQKDGILIHQEKYAKDLLKRFNMDKAKSISTPMHPSCNTLPITILCLSHRTTLRSCYCYLRRPCLTAISSHLQTFLNYLEIIWK